MLNFHPCNYNICVRSRDFGIKHKVIFTNMLSRLFTWARGSKFDQSLQLYPYFVCGYRQGFDKTVWIRRLVRVFADGICDKYQNLMNWLMCQ